MFYHQQDPRGVRSLEEEMREVGLNPERTMGQMERHCELLEHGPMPRDLSGLPEGSEDVPRSIQEVGRSLKESAPKLQPGQVIVNEEELTEVFKLVRKIIKTAAEKLKQKREYLRQRSAKRKEARQFRKTHKRQIKKTAARLLQRFGSWAKAKMARRGGKVRVVQQSLDQFANLREELAMEGKAKMPDVSPYEEAAVNSAILLDKLADVFQYVDEGTTNALDTLAGKALTLYEEIEFKGNDITAEQEERLRAIVIGCAKALEAYEDMGSPTVYDLAEQENGNGKNGNGENGKNGKNGKNGEDDEEDDDEEDDDGEECEEQANGKRRCQKCGIEVGPDATNCPDCNLPIEGQTEARKGAKGPKGPKGNGEDGSDEEQQATEARKGAKGGCKGDGEDGEDGEQAMEARKGPKGGCKGPKGDGEDGEDAGEQTTEARKGAKGPKGNGNGNGNGNGCDGEKERKRERKGQNGGNGGDEEPMEEPTSEERVPF